MKHAIGIVIQFRFSHPEMKLDCKESRVKIRDTLQMAHSFRQTLHFPAAHHSSLPPTKKMTSKDLVDYKKPIRVRKKICSLNDVGLWRKLSNILKVLFFLPLVASPFPDLLCVGYPGKKRENIHFKVVVYEPPVTPRMAPNSISWMLLVNHKKYMVVVIHNA